MIGTNSTGTKPVSNGDDGVFIDGSDGNVIGGPEPLAANVISANQGSGVRDRRPDRDS